jgi:anti-sigma B factor antagonist
LALEVAAEYRDDLVILTLRGELDIYTVPDFRRDTAPLAIEGARVVIDMDGVTLLDSSGLGAVVALRARARGVRGVVAIASTSRPVLRVFEVTGLRATFPMGDDVAAAVQAIENFSPEA